MSALDRVKQALMGIGLLTVLGVGAFAGVLAYIWWDSRSTDDEFSVDAEFEGDDSAGDEFDAGPSVESDETAAD